MKSKLLVVISLCLLMGCKEETYMSTVDKEFHKVKTLKDQKRFLQTIHKDGQGLILKKEELQENYFKNKDSIHLIENKTFFLKPKNLYRVKKYLERFEYPDTLSFSENERLSIYYAILNYNEAKVQLAYLETLQNARAKNFISSHQYLGYLLRVYYIKNASFYKFDKNHTVEQIIDDLEPIIIQYTQEPN